MTVDANFQTITATFIDLDKAIVEEKFDAALEMIAQLKDQAQTNVFINPEELTTKETAIQVVKCEKQFNTVMDQLCREQKAGDIGNNAKIQHLESVLQELIENLESWGVNTKDQ